MVGELTVKSQRNGAKEVVQLTSRKDPKRLNVKNFYDFQAHKVYSLDLNTSLCNEVAYASPYAPPLNDVVGGAFQFTEELVKLNAKSVPGETIAGLPTRLFEISGAEGIAKLWVEPENNIPMRYVMTMKDGTNLTLFEISELSFAAPPAAVFLFPKNCRHMEGSTDANGGHIEVK
jgi:outer membrane lipoprotein-sorting protein